MFERVYKAMRPNGILVTYSAKGSVRRSMQEVGLVVERLLFDDSSSIFQHIKQRKPKLACLIPLFL